MHLSAVALVMYDVLMASVQCSVQCFCCMVVLVVLGWLVVFQSSAFSRWIGHGGVLEEHKHLFNTMTYLAAPNYILQLSKHRNGLGCVEGRRWDACRDNHDEVYGKTVVFGKQQGIREGIIGIIGYYKNLL